jgi:hypothetical protein
MPRKPIELLPEVAKAFLDDMRAFFAAGHDTTKADDVRLSDIEPVFTCRSVASAGPMSARTSTGGGCQSKWWGYRCQ